MLLVADDASAFCRTRTVLAPPEDGCSNLGRPLYWPAVCFPYRLRAKALPGVPVDVLADRMARAFATWTAPNAKCSPGLTAVELAPVDDVQVSRYEFGGANRNVVGSAEVWSAGDELLGRPTLRFEPETGRIVDADLELNADASWSFAATPPAEAHDLESALLHDIGHLLGIAHATRPDAVMFATRTPGEVKRQLSEDDMDAVCAIYPDRATRVGATTVAATPCELAPGRVEGCSEVELLNGCSLRPFRARVGRGLPVLGLAAIAWLRRRGRKVFTPRSASSSVRAWLSSTAAAWSRKR